MGAQCSFQVLSHLLASFAVLFWQEIRNVNERAFPLPCWRKRKKKCVMMCALMRHSPLCVHKFHALVCLILFRRVLP
jgi:hypothetical protein